ncbi:unnamed protein product [Rhizophagus irregularis]|uniref:Uncharacterized protein n=1 Tax=Rhizophagus irregularis TaxID=588596 RepID=A0A2N1MYB6_9GLOM|nr:hypothetical protein RhiirC2_852735 [Rhizophagus irregularis]CAB4376273.1 unnamed protein product [Rhizophagus irregularis]
MTVSDTATNPSELDLLRQRITELEARKAELEVENAEIPELRKKLAEIPELRKKLAEVEARNAELIKQIMEENNRRDAKIEDTNDRVAKLEQLQNDNTPDNNSSNFAKRLTANLGADHHEKPGMDNEVNNKSIGKIQRESTDHGVTSDIVNVSETVSNDEESDEPEINNITNCTPSESSHGIEEVAPQTVNVDVSQDIKVGLSENSELSRDAKTVNTVHCFSENSNLSQDSSSKIVTEFVQVPGSISIKRLANSFCQANGARNKSIIAKQTEISLWWCYSEKFEDKVVELRSGNKKLTDKTARSQIYAEMKPYLTGVSDGYLRKITSKARKINKLFGYEYDPVTLQKIKGIGGHMIQRVTYSVDSISRLTNPQIEYIIEQVKSKTITDQSSVDETNEEVASRSDKTEMLSHDDIDCSHDNNSEEMPDIDFGLDDEIIDSKPADDKIFDDSSEDEVDHPTTSESSSESDSDYDEQLHEELTREEMERIARLEALEAIESQPDIDFDLDDEIIDDKPEDIKIFDDIDFDLDEEIIDDKPVDSSHPINARSEGISVQA